MLWLRKIFGAWTFKKTINFSLLCVLTAIVFLNDLGHFNTDIKPEVYIAPGEMINQFLHSWTETPYLGSTNFNVGLVPVLLALWLLRAIGLSPEIAFKTFHLFLWIIAAYGAFRLVQRLVPKVGYVGGIAAAVFYLANPYTIHAGSTLAIALPLAFLPWMLLAFIHAMQRPNSWVWPGIMGLLFFFMSGMNVAVVPIFELLALIPIAVSWVLSKQITVKHVLLVLSKVALFVIGVSLYWLVPAYSARTAGLQVASNSETLTGIHKHAGFTEVVRGLGLWPLYGRDQFGAWIPEHALYVSSGLIMMLTIFWPVLAILGMTVANTRTRRLMAVTAGSAVVIMVGLFPSEHNPLTPFGHLLVRIFHTGPLIAFRTTNKIGAVLALMFALGLAIGVTYLWRRFRGHPAQLSAVGIAAMLLFGWTLPAISGGLYTSRMDIPDYWRQTAAEADKGDSNSATLLLPGQIRSSYRWTEQRPDDVTNSLMKRSAVIPETEPNASRPGANFLSALDDSLQTATAPPGTISLFAKYLGADRVILRNDLLWEHDGGVRPSDASALVSNDPGLFGLQNFGKPGEFTMGPGTDGSGHGEAVMHPTQLFSVNDAKSLARTTSLRSTYTVVGDAWAIPQMVRAGNTQALPLFYAAFTPKEEFVKNLGPTHQLFLTDTNARRQVIPERLTSGQGHLLQKNSFPPEGRTLGDNADDQTTADISGPQAQASSSGGAFFDLPYASANNAIDGDLRTAWRFGDFRTAPGNTLTITFPEERLLNDIPVTQAELGPVRIDQITISAGGQHRKITLPDDGPAVATFPNIAAKTLHIRIDSLRGDGFNLVGLSEVSIPGEKSRTAARVPDTFTRLYQDLSEQQQTAFAHTPLTVLFSRVLNTSSPSDDTETQMRRIFTLPDDRDFAAQAWLRLSGNEEQMYDLAAGYDPRIRAESSAFHFKRPEARASTSLNDNDKTGWVPGAGVRGAWWQIRTPGQEFSQVRIVQSPGPEKTATTYARRIDISVDGKKVASQEVHAGENLLQFPAVTGKTLRITITAAVGSDRANPARFTVIDPGVKMHKIPPSPVDIDGKNRCFQVAELDGKPVWMRIAAQTAVAVNESPGTKWQNCTPLPLTKGEHRLEPYPPFVLDHLILAPQIPVKTMDTQPSTVSRVVRNIPTRKELQVETGSGPYVAVLAQSYDRRWQATINGKSLGSPVLVDGFAMGWTVADGKTGHIVMRFRPQRWSWAALAISAAVLIIIAALIVRSGRKDELFTHPDRPLFADQENSTFQLPQWVRDLGFLAIAGFGVGWAGVVAAATVVIARRIVHIPRVIMAAIGGGTMVIGMAWFVIIHPTLGSVNPDALLISMWPQYLVAAGLTIGLAAVFMNNHLGENVPAAKHVSQASKDNLPREPENNEEK